MTPAATPPHGMTLPDALADELTLASRLLGDLAYTLFGDERTLRTHMTELQAIDRITQMQLAIAAMLRSMDDPDAAIGEVTLEDMAARIRQAMAGATAEMQSAA